MLPAFLNKKLSIFYSMHAWNFFYNLELAPEIHKHCSDFLVIFIYGKLNWLHVPYKIIKIKPLSTELNWGYMGELTLLGGKYFKTSTLALIFVHILLCNRLWEQNSPHIKVYSMQHYNNIIFWNYVDR